MNDETKTGGHAFPSATIIHDEVLHTGGMTLRDYFAAKALACWHLGHCTEDYRKHAARQAYAIADAMLEERKRHDQ